MGQREKKSPLNHRNRVLFLRKRVEKNNFLFMFVIFSTSCTKSDKARYLHPWGHKKERGARARERDGDRGRRREAATSLLGGATRYSISSSIYELNE